MSFAARPDWRSPLPIAQRRAYAAFDQPGRFLLPPQALAAYSVDGESPLRLDIVQQDRGNALARYSILSLAFAADFGLSEARQAAFDLGQRVQLAPLAVEGGWLRLNAVQALDLPPALGELLSLDAASLGAMNLAVRLDSAGTDLFVAALQRGLLAVGASAWLRVRGVAERVPLTLTFDPAALLAAVRALAGGGNEIDAALLRQRLLDAPHLLGLGLPERSADIAKETLADAVLDRIAARFATPKPSPADAPVGATLAFDAAAMSSGRVQWNLADALLAPRLLILEADPLGPLRTLPAGELHDRVVRRFDARALASGWRSLSVRANLPSRRVGVVSAQVDVQVPAKPPARMFTVKATAPLTATDRPTTLDLRLSPTETLAYQWQTSAVLLSDGRAETLKGPLRSGEREHLLVGVDDFGLRWLPVEAEPAFLQQADIDAECFGTRKGKPWSARGTLDAARPELAFAVPFDVDDAAIRAVARAKSDGAQRAMAPQPADSLRLDAFSFDGSGSRELALECEFDDDARQCAIEIAPEDGIDDPQRRKRLSFTRARPRQDWGWLALSPFRGGYRWRWNAQATWSPVLQPDAPLRLRSSEAALATTN
ncbi:hypothetical protein J5226_00660 [Lysobacter sp. K5869]|uniref:hypothetical protein n=1 Tax=Lysobacter sp. K5869 TaxID=2820808 RepID=UPI001C0627D7|nr:hypothetical protein [Lysobacter sp. K5869]QWP76954.1 hypothetical protein J5226_00660 [Lysobacter sp. K5869]